MNKIEKIKELLYGDPTLWEAYMYDQPWSDAELNAMMENEALLKIPELALQFNKPEAALVAKYFELRSGMDEKIILDVLIKPEGSMSWNAFRSLAYTLEELTQNVTIMPAKVGDLIKVNVRTIQAFSPDTDVALFFSTSGAIQGIHASAPKTDPNMWACASAQVVAKGHFNMGTMITGLKRSVMFIVD